VTDDEVGDPQNLELWLEVNGRRRQAGNTRTMIFGVKTLVSHVSRYMTLLPGNILATGGFYGDEVKLGIEGLGLQTQKIAAHSTF
jgi:2,4-diketo-3-deoxy-L-fuconate hydrolase